MYWLAVELVGLGMVMAAWVFFRRSGVASSTWWPKVPVWRANQYLKPAGTALWIAGILVAVVGAIPFGLWVLRSGR
jgi:hypothetical protein